MRTLLRDLQFAIRLFRSNPGFTAVVILTLTLGIAANTTVFSWIDELLLRPFPGAADGGRLAVLQMVTAGAPNGANQISYPDYLDYRANLKSLAGLAVHHEDVFSLGEPGRSEAVWGELVSGNYFDMLGVKPELGRTFSADEDGDKVNAYPVAVISDGLWRRRFHADPKVVGSTLRVNNGEFTVIGVAAPEFRGTMPGLVFDIWTPVTMAPQFGVLDERGFRERGTQWLYALGRLQPGVSIRQAGAEAATFARSLEAAYPKSNRGIGAIITPVWEFPSAAPGLLLKPLRMLMAISLLLMLIVCANVANLLLARIIARRKELSIRLAVGAQGARLGRQLFTETLLLAGVSAVAGLLLASWMADVLPSLIPRIGVHVALGFAMSWRVLAFTILICVVAAIVSSAMPVLLWLRADVNSLLKESGRGGGHGLASNRTRGLLVVFEVAVATLAVIGAGLFLRSFDHARAMDPGFDRDRMVLTRFYLAGTGFNKLQLQDFSVRLRDRLLTAPGVADVAYADYAPLGSNAGPYDDIVVEGYTPGPAESLQINRYRISPGYFRVMRTALVEGRDFAESDDGSAAPVMIVNQTFARRYFGGGNAVGRRVRNGRVSATVIGVAQDSKYFDVAEAPRPHFFVPFRQQASATNQLYFFLKASGSPAPVMAGMRREVAAVDANIGAFDVMAMSDWTDVTLLPHKVAATLAAGLGAISLLLAAVGLYGVMAYAVSQRTQEIGIRMALGARPQDVLGDVLLQGMSLTLAGVAAGTAAALAAARLVAGTLVNLSANDPLAFGGGAVFLLAVALLASYLPARRATRVDPMSALRSE
jgi:predicted permease